MEDAVAIVGYSHRMPGGIVTDDDFWRLLSEREIVREPIVDRYERGFRPIGTFSGPGRLASPYEGLIRDGREMLFDRNLFGMSHNEMLTADPHVRMLLTCTWETCERAGWDLHALRNSRTGVFVGAQVPSHSNWRAPLGANEFTVPSISLAMLANRISYHFNLMGPSLTCCTACSASLTALHDALNALRTGDCEQAVVATASYLGSSRQSAGFNALGVISPDGKCHSFDADANGYLRSEGAFVFAIKPLAAAERDGDPIHAVVEATAVNAAGAADGSVGLAQGRYITAPTRHAQVELMREASARAGRTPEEFDYVEAHATGTVVGDRIEGNAIGEALGGGDREAPLRVAGVKSNVGHMEAAAFGCALLKVVLMMQRRTFAPVSSNHLVPNPEIDFDAHGMQVQTECEPFPDHLVVIGINSFGFGGSNGHCVVREYRPEQPRIWSVPPAPRAGYLVPLSARTTAALVESARGLRAALDEPPADLYTLAGNLSRRRTHFAARAAFAVHDTDQLKEALDAYAEDPEPAAIVEEGRRRLLMVFTGQGTQWAGCGSALYDAHPVFRRAVDAIEEHWREHADHSLRAAAFAAPQAELNECRLAQPVTFMLQCALVELFKTWGVYPDCVLGHSSGEVAAAYASGALSLAEATRLVYHRATLQQRTAGSGRMLPIGLDLAGVERLLDELEIPFRAESSAAPPVEIACENAPASTVICGTIEALRPVMEELERRNLQHRLLAGNIAFHSAAMDPLREDAYAALAFLDERAFDAAVPFISSVTGEHIERLDSAYWWTNIRRRVRFAAALETAVRVFRPDVVLELAPHCALQSSIVQCLEGSASRAVSIPTFRRETDVCLGFHEALGALFRAGVELDFAGTVSTSRADRPPAARLSARRADSRRPDERRRNVPAGERVRPRSADRPPGCRATTCCSRRGCRCATSPGWPSTACTMPRSCRQPATSSCSCRRSRACRCTWRTLEFLQPCPIPTTPVRLQTELFPVPNAPGRYTFTISSRGYEVDAKSELHSRGTLRLVSSDHPVTGPQRLADIDSSRFEPYYYVGETDFYERLEASLGETFQYGPHFRNIQRVLWEDSTANYLFDVELDEQLWSDGREEGYVVNPALLDGSLQIFLYHLLHATDIFSMPRRAVGLTFLRPPTVPRLTCYVEKEPDWADINEMGQYTERRGDRSGGSIRVYDGATGELVLCIDAYLSFNSNPSWNDRPHSKHAISWQPKFVPDARFLQPRLAEGNQDELEPAALIAALEQPVAGAGQRYACRVIEIAAARPPEHTAVTRCFDYLGSIGAQTEYWLLGAADEQVRAYYDAFHNRDAALRFAALDLNAEQTPELNTGLLRPHVAEILLLHDEAATYGPEQWRLLRRLAVPGGLALVCHDRGAPAAGAATDTAAGGESEPDSGWDGAGWITLRSGPRATLLQAPQVVHEVAEPPQLAAPRWVIGEPGSLADEWLARLEKARSPAAAIPYAELADDRVADLADWPHAADLQAIDFLCGEDPDDPTGERLAWRLAAFVRALIPFRVAQAQAQCRLTLVTRRAVFEVTEPRGRCRVGGATRHHRGGCRGCGYGCADRLPPGGPGRAGGSGDLGPARWLRSTRA